MYKVQEGPRFEYREQENQRVKDSPTLAVKYPQLKALVVDLGYYNAAGTYKNSQIKFTPSLQNGKSVVRIDCPNNGCVGGDFDLTEPIAEAVAQHRTTVTAEMCCQGWQNKTTIDTVHCHSILRYTLSLEY
jgi:hypothetical protein